MPNRRVCDCNSKFVDHVWRRCVSSQPVQLTRAFVKLSVVSLMAKLIGLAQAVG